MLVFVLEIDLDTPLVSHIVVIRDHNFFMEYGAISSPVILQAVTEVMESELISHGPWCRLPAVMKLLFLFYLLIVCYFEDRLC